jgi:hypothetical protein
MNSSICFHFACGGLDRFPRAAALLKVIAN